MCPAYVTSVQEAGKGHQIPGLELQRVVSCNMAPETERWFSVRAPPALNHWTNSAGKQVFSEIVITYKQVRTGKQNACWKQVCFLLKKKKKKKNSNHSK